MKKTAWNDGWTVDGRAVTLPHDAMISEKRNADSPGGSGGGFFPGGIYTYEKTFTVKKADENRTRILEFEGVYRNARVLIDGDEKTFHAYGYTPFTVDISGLEKGEHKITVIADNSELPNTRWYSGSGIYRPVYLWEGGRKAIAVRGVQVTTLGTHPAEIRVVTDADEGDVRIRITDGDEVIAEGEGRDVRFTIPGAKLWSEDNPYLYTCMTELVSGGRVTDSCEEKFGIRSLRWSNRGFFVNGRSVLLRGACVHHDSGILGAATYDESEWRRVRILRENGFNAIRSSHNPASTAMLEACDALGMYVMDETYDMWYNRKNKFDYGLNFDSCWEEDITAMVRRDINHPSVIMYSIGNEVAEPAEQRGLDVAKAQIDLVHKLDPSRPVTCGVNLMIVGRAASGKGLYQDGEQKSGGAGGKEGGNASLAFNIMASLVGSGMNRGGNSKKTDRITSPFVDMLDVAGYNYGSGRYPLDGKAHPDRVIFGSETFPQDIYRNWSMVKKYPYLFGDFMWTGWDYLGETGIGAWSYTGGMPFNRPYPWLLAGAGVIDILGNPDGSCKYAQVVWEQENNPVIAVRPVNHAGEKLSKSVWRGTNAMLSWSYKGCEGNKAEVEVFSQGDYAELYINGRKIGKKKLKECKALFHTKYEPGVITAVVYNSSGAKIGETELRSAAEDAALTIRFEKSSTGESGGNIADSARPGEILYVPVTIEDTAGIVESNADRLITVSVTGGELLAFGSANPRTEEQYHTGSFTSYYGRALAVVRAGKEGEVTITASDGRESSSATILISK